MAFYYFFTIMIGILIGHVLYDLFVKIDIRRDLRSYIFCTLFLIALTIIDCFGSVMLLKYINAVN